MFALIPYPEIDPAVFTLPAVDLGGLHLGPFPLRWYALAYIAGLVLGWRYMVFLVKREQLWNKGQRRPSAVDCDDFLFWATLGVIVGGRLGFVLFYAPDLIWTAPLKMFAIWEGGMSFHGGLLGVATAVIYFALKPRHNPEYFLAQAKTRALKKPAEDQRSNYVEVPDAGWITKEQDAKLRSESLQPIPLLTLGDIVAACAPIGLFFGRIANFINGELWGRPTDLPWAMIFPRSDGLPRHPSQLYEACLEGILLFSILFFTTHKLQAFKRPGLNVGVFLVCYGLFRSLVENVREPDVGMDNFPFGLTMGMMLSTPMILLGAWLIWRALNGVQPKPKKA